MKGSVSNQGAALIITLLVSLILMIALMGISTNITIGNRQSAGNQSLAERAQFAAESGLARGVQNLTQIRDDLELAQLDLSSGISNQAQLNAAMATLRAQMYAFCYGGALTQSIPSTFNIQPSNLPAEGQLLCTNPIAPVSQSDSDATVGNTRMALIKDNIALSAYTPSGRFADDAAEAAYWGQIAKGTYSPSITLSTGANGISDRVRLTLDLSPQNIRITSKGYQILLGNPNRGMVSLGEVVSGSTVLASRTITQSLPANLNPARITMSAPSFASFGWFYNTHRQSINPADAAYNQATQITSSLQVNGPAFTNGRFVFASGAAPTFASQFGSAGCENGVPSGGSCSGAAQQYHVGGIGSGSLKTASSASQWSGLSGISPSFAIKKNEQGQELCWQTVASVTSEVVCGPSATNADKVRDVNWGRSTIEMPATAVSNFQTQASNGGISVNSSDFDAAWTAGWKSFTNFSDICVNASNANCNPMPSQALDSIGKFEGRPTIALGTVNNSGQTFQRITVTANAVRGYNFALSPDCGGSGGGGGPSGGTGGADAPQLRRWWVSLEPKLGELMQALGSALTFGSTALAANTNYSSSWRCPSGTPRAGQAPTSWWTYWTQDDDDIGTVVIDRATGKPSSSTSGANATGNNLYFNSNTNENLSIVYEVNSAGQIRMVSNNTSATVSTQTINPSRSSSNSIASRTPPALATAGATSVSSSFGSASFNGVLFRDGNFHLEGGSGADIAAFQQITVSSSRSIYLTGDVTYQTNPLTNTGANTPRNLLGIYAKNDIMLTDWDRANSSTDGRSIDGVLMAETGSIRAGGFDWEGNNGRDVTSCNFASKGNFTVKGSLIQNTLGATNCINNSGAVTGGYVGRYTYDDRMLRGFAPPAFPNFSTGNWGFQAEVTIDTTQRGFWRVVTPSN